MEDFFVADETGDKDTDRLERGSKLTKKFTFAEKRDLNRAVTSIDFSPFQSELLLASYSKSSQWNMDEPDGMIDILSLSL